MKNDYATWICYKCARANGGRSSGLSTFHNGICDICLKERTVTEPRDYRLSHLLKTKAAGSCREPARNDQEVQDDPTMEWEE